jgi:hypothetical protein
MGKLSLAENDFIQSYVYTGDHSGFELRAAAHSELPILTEMCGKSLLGTPPCLSDPTEQHRYLAELWEADAESVVVITKHELIKGVATPIRLHAATREVFFRNSITNKLVLHPDLADCDYFFWLLGVDPPMDPDTLSYIFRNLFLPRLPGNKVTMMTWLDETVEAIHLLHVEELTWANHRAGGLNFRFFLHDSREDYSMSSIKENRSGETLTLTLSERIEWTKNYLQHYQQLDAYIRSLTLDRAENVPSSAGRSSDSMAQLIRDTYTVEYTRLNKGTHHEVTLGRILKYAYMNKRGTHEQVAALLHLSQATYYRQLKKLITLLADKLPN